MKESFREVRLSKDNKKKLDLINSIINEYKAAGYVLTLRQLFYQLVTRNVIPNKVAEYAKLSNLLKEGRMAGIVDWSAIEDRLRLPYTPAAWDSPEEIMDTVISQYKQPRMAGQENYLEVWVEKDALSGVLKRVTSKYHVPILVNRGYSSASAMYDSYNRFRQALASGQKVNILYLGDFDPSGTDMIRDVYERPLEMLTSQSVYFVRDAYDKWVEAEYDGDEAEAYDYLSMRYQDEKEYPFAFEKEDGELHFDTLNAFIIDRFKVIPIALTREQIRQYNPPPNPAKRTDPRSKKFISEHGGSSWEVDALRPEVLNNILTNAIESRIDLNKYNAVLRQEEIGRTKLKKAQAMLEQIDVDDSELESDDE